MSNLTEFKKGFEKNKDIVSYTYKGIPHKELRACLPECSWSAIGGFAPNYNQFSKEMRIPYREWLQEKKGIDM